MNPNWRSFLESAEGVFAADSTDLLHFGDAAGELAAAGKQTVLVPLTHLGLLSASGEDAKSFLHSQFTSDINHLAADQAQHAGWCSAKGRMQASFLVWNDAADYRLLLAADLQDATQKRLQMFVLRAEVKLAALTDQSVLLGVGGDQAVEALNDAGLPVPAGTMNVAQANGVTVLRLDDKRYIVVAPDAASRCDAALLDKSDPEMVYPRFRRTSAIPLIPEPPIPTK